METTMHMNNARLYGINSTFLLCTLDGMVYPSLPLLWCPVLVSCPDPPTHLPQVKGPWNRAHPACNQQDV